MASMRAALDPFNAALGRTPDYFVVSSFVPLPIINQKLAQLHPVGGNAFFVTLRGIMEVVSSTSAADVNAALHPPSPPPGPGKGGGGGGGGNPPKPQPTIGYTFAGADPGDSAARDYVIGGAGFQANETVDIVDSYSGSAVFSTPADGVGRYSATLAFNAGTALQLFARGEKSGLQSKPISFVA